MNQQLWKESLLFHREQIIELADPDDVLLNRLLDRLLAANCLQLDQKEVIKKKDTARERCGTLLDFVQTEGLVAFNELCEALENFVTRHTKDLVDSLRDKAESKSPTLKHVIPSDGRWVVGLTFINNELFVLRHPSEEEIQVYETATFTQQRTVRVARLRDDGYSSLTSCDVNNFLFVCDGRNVYKVVLSIDIVINWEVDGLLTGLSVNDARHVIVTCCLDNEIREYEHTGQLIRTIKLQESHVTRPLTAPRHAVQLNESMFIVSHWRPVSGVSLIDTRGRITATYRNSESTQLLNYPRQLTVGKNGSVLVVDCDNNRLVVLDASLDNARELTLPIDGGLNHPGCFCFNESLSQLFVGEDDGQRVVICDNVRI